MARHDQLFKTLFRTFFDDLLHLVAEDLVDALDLATVRFHDKEIFSDAPHGRRSELDLVAAVQPRGRKSRTETWILVHVEIERRYRRPFAARFWRYYMQLRLRHPGSPVFPVVVFLQGGPRGVVDATYRESVLGRSVVEFSYRSFGLSGSSAAEHIARPQPLAWALASLMRAPTWAPSEHKIACLRPIARAPLDDARRFLLMEAVETYLPLEEPEQLRYHRQVETDEPEIHTMELSFPEKLRAEGRSQGQRQMLQRLLERRFGPLSSSVRERLDSVRDADELLRLGDRILDARSLDELGLAG
ncbi:MAG: DUF4351 domain-containing protein [Acidobacteriota bacterium]